MKPFKLTGPLLQERDVTTQIITYLRFRGWRCHRLHVGRFRSMDGRRVVSIGQEGEPDWLCVHADFQPFYLEIKRPSERLRRSQELWILSARRDGFRVLDLAGRKDPLEWFMEEYERIRLEAL